MTNSELGYLLGSVEIRHDGVEDILWYGRGVAAGGEDKLAQRRLQVDPHLLVVVVILQDPVQALKMRTLLLEMSLCVHSVSL